MLGFLRNLLARRDAEAAPKRDSPASFGGTATPPAFNGAAKPHPNGNGSRNNVAAIRLPFDAILRGLPGELHPRHARREAAGETVPIPLDVVLPQLSRGVVKISFGELRKAAPQLFSPDSDLDNVEVVLPLGEILSRLNPAFLLRRRSQKMVEVPEEVGNPFGPEGQVLTGAHVVPPPATPPEPPPQAAPAVSRPRPGLFTAVPPAASRNPLISMPGSASLTTPACPAPPSLSPPGFIAMPELDRARGEAAEPPPMPTVSMPGAPLPAMPMAAVASTPAAQPLLVALAPLANGWPDAVRGELLRLHLLDAKLALPAQTIEQALKQGRVAFSWKALRSWLRPAIPPETSPEDNTVLELPLRIIAPLFLARKREAGHVRERVAIDETIPNLFYGQPPEGAGSPPASAEENSYYVWHNGAKPGPAPAPAPAPAAAPAPAPAHRHIPATGTRFIAKYATPNEIVSRAAALDHVAGALIGLPDGLLVASRLGNELNADTLAAFLPQIFSKVSQSTKELRMGDLNELGFTIGTTPWRLFRVNAIFFAVFGHAGQPLPSSELAALAAELDHKPR